MSQKANPTVIGLFIVLGVGLGVAGVLLFSSLRLFAHTQDCVVYFNESLNGLNEGAPVKYRGVTIGSVKRVMVRFNQATNDYAMPVVLELEQDLIQPRLGEPLQTFTADFLDDRIRHGLRASLRAESLVTGVLYVELSPDPAAPPPVYHQLQPRFPEIPSEPTQVQAFINNLATIDFKGISTNLTALLSRLDLALSELRMKEMSAGVTNTLASLNRLIASPDLTNSLAAARAAFEQYRALGEKLNGRVEPLAQSITNSLAQADRALAELRGAAENLRGALRPEAPLQHNLDELLRQLAGTAESASTLMQFLHQHPNALITGREQPPKP